MIRDIEWVIFDEVHCKSYLFLLVFIVISLLFLSSYHDSVIAYLIRRVTLIHIILIVLYAANRALLPRHIIVHHTLHIRYFIITTIATLLVKYVSF